MATIPELLRETCRCEVHVAPGGDATFAPADCHTPGDLSGLITKANMMETLGNQTPEAPLWKTHADNLRALLATLGEGRPSTMRAPESIQAP